MNLLLFLFKFLLVGFGVGFGIGYLIIKAKSLPSEQKGKELLHDLRSNTPNIRQILGEMRFIAEATFELYDEYNYNKANANKSIIYALSHFGRQNKLVLAMNYNVKAEWEPRFKFLKEIQTSFYNETSLYNAFIECKKINRGIQKTTLWNMNLSAFYEHYTKMAKIALKGVAFGAIASVAVVGVMGDMVNKAGKDIGYSPKSNARYRNPNTGNLFDEDGNRVPW